MGQPVLGPTAGNGPCRPVDVHLAAGDAAYLAGALAGQEEQPENVPRLFGHPGDMGDGTGRRS